MIICVPPEFLTYKTDSLILQKYYKNYLGRYRFRWVFAFFTKYCRSVIKWKKLDQINAAGDRILISMSVLILLT